MRIQIFAAFAVVCACSSLPQTGFAEQPGATVSHPGLFSYQAPPGWLVVNLPRIENPVATDPAQRETNPYIEVDASTSTASLADFAEASKKSAKSMVPSAEFLEQGPFVTNSGLQGIRIVATFHPGKHDYKAIYYLFTGSKNIKFTIVANVSPEGFEKNAPIFDAAMKTFTAQ